jgi:tripartite-type tricarboxylate transporter receptor subunit TctC
MSIRILSLAVAVTFSALMGSAVAQTYPSGTVRLVVPYPPGGGVDGLARPLAERLSALWGKPVIVENRAGAATIIGSDFVAKSKPDGLTLLFTTDSSITSNPHLFASLPFDPMKDLVPVTQLIDLYQMIVVNPAVKANTMKEFVALAKTSSKPMAYGSFGAGSQPNLLFEALKQQSGIDLTHVPYKGIAPSIQATVANEVQATLGSPAVAGPQMKGGKMKALAIAAQKRSPLHPEVPTLSEAGFTEISLRSWFGILAPKGTPSDIIEKISKDVTQVMSNPEFDSVQVTGRGFSLVASTPAEFAAMIADDYKQKGQIIKAAGIKVD